MQNFDWISPYLLIRDALKIITKMEKKLTDDRERKALALINAAEDNLTMSRYQLSFAHKAMGDMYYVHGYTGSALQQYKIGLELNEKLPVRRRLKELEKLPQDELRYSLSPDTVEDLTIYPEYKKLMEKTGREIGSTDYRRDPVQAVREQTYFENKLYFPEVAEEIEKGLARLPEYYRAEFYRHQMISARNPHDLLTQAHLDILRLKAMLRSAEHRGEIQDTEEE